MARENLKQSAGAGTRGLDLHELKRDGVGGHRQHLLQEPCPQPFKEQGTAGDTLPLKNVYGIFCPQFDGFTDPWGFCLTISISRDTFFLSPHPHSPHPPRPGDGQGFNDTGALYTRSGTLPGKGGSVMTL